MKNIFQKCTVEGFFFNLLETLGPLVAHTGRQIADTGVDGPPRSHLLAGLKWIKASAHQCVCVFSLLYFKYSLLYYPLTLR